MQAVILAGGKGKRLLPFTRVFPKPLVPLGDRPILDMILRQLKHFGFTRVTLAVGHMAEMIQTYVQQGERYGLAIEYSYEDEPLGTAGPLAQISNLESRFLVMNGDLVTTLDYQDLLAFHQRHGAVATIGTYQKTFKVELGIVENDEHNFHAIVGYIEKPVFTFSVSMGIYVFEAEVLQYIEPNKYLDFPHLVKRLLVNKQKVVSYPFDGYWLDIGTHTDYEKALEEFELIKEKLHLD
ncbi:MAG: nucleotidyltransferase family protein [Nitrospinota bacterium]|nr:MAG: nucleotidyltransferase family protein [Nitrospinota bacterium]